VYDPSVILVRKGGICCACLAGVRASDNLQAGGLHVRSISVAYPLFTSVVVTPLSAPCPRSPTLSRTLLRCCSQLYLNPPSLTMRMTLATTVDTIHLQRIWLKTSQSATNSNDENAAVPEVIWTKEPQPAAIVKNTAANGVSSPQAKYCFVINFV
jgi:hypothetical protein